MTVDEYVNSLSQIGDKVALLPVGMDYYRGVYGNKINTGEVVRRELDGSQLYLTLRFGNGEVMKYQSKHCMYLINNEFICYNDLHSIMRENKINSLL